MSMIQLPDITSCIKNDDPVTNGESLFYNQIKNNITTIFDVGCRADSLFSDFKGNVHYFDPVESFIDKLKAQPNSNIQSHYNKFGLSDKDDTLTYYPAYQSFYNRIDSCGKSDEANKITLKVRDARSYIIQNNISAIDFVKIDTEGHEMKVIYGFGDQIEKVKMLQFEYGGTYIDTKIKLADIIYYLTSRNFCMFSYLSPNGIMPIVDFIDHYHYCNIVCFNKKYL